MKIKKNDRFVIFRVPSPLKEEFERGRIIGLKEAVCANRKIARRIGRLDVAIRRGWQEWVDNGRVQCQDVSGLLKATADWEDRLIVQLAIIAPDSTLLTIRRVTRTRVPTMVILRWLIERNLSLYRQLRHLPLSPPHFQAILQWCLAGLGCNHADYGRIILSNRRSPGHSVSWRSSKTCMETPGAARQPCFPY
ncbi:HTH_Tnp_Tc3_2 domain-containing protein [Trichonephila clavipes]|nr:HTH_Tnp_Tc3_2 domain-containing protein [Trichonephila clavipes]